jgi:hypothetical protein
MTSSEMLGIVAARQQEASWMCLLVEKGFLNSWRLRMKRNVGRSSS